MQEDSIIIQVRNDCGFNQGDKGDGKGDERDQILVSDLMWIW